MLNRAETGQYLAEFKRRYIERSIGPIRIDFLNPNMRVARSEMFAYLRDEMGKSPNLLDAEYLAEITRPWMRKQARAEGWKFRNGEFYR
jgi:hypothetical protein